MRKVTKYYREIKIVYLKTAFFIILTCLLLFPSFHKIEKTGDNMYTVFLNGKEVGMVDSRQTAEEYLW